MRDALVAVYSSTHDQIDTYRLAAYLFLPGMPRLTLLFEWEDLPWFPDVIRTSMTDYLRFVFELTNFYSPVVPVIAEAIRESDALQVVDLCSGGGGPVHGIQQKLQHQLGRGMPFILTDKFPNLTAFRQLSATNMHMLSCSEPVDARAVPASLPGFRTVFSGIHHFSPGAVQLILQDAVTAQAGIAIVDAGRAHILVLMLVNLLQPLLVMLFTPFIQPFRWSRLFFTYVLPIIPFCVAWDGFVSITRLYQHHELLQIGQRTGANGYQWRSGIVKNCLGMPIAWLTGLPCR